ncbi:MAG: magnesium/cobalt transporter CorA [Crocinitomicaceae bacterium]|nr:magnesium/cobalt transporter CorA [Crocinitomicaceae bacterium]
MENSECQLYKYNASFFLVKKETSSYFAQNFLLTELDDDHVAWLNFHSIADIPSIQALCLNLKIDKIGIENIFNEARRPKVEENNGYIFFNVISVLPSQNQKDLIHKDQITFFLAKNYLISLQSIEGKHFHDVRDRIEKDRGKIRTKKSDFLLFRSLEAIVDNYFEVLDNISEEMELIHEKLHKSEDKSLLLKIEVERRKLIELKKIAGPMLDISVQLLGSDSALIDKNNFVYFNTLHHSCSHVITEIESQKQILDGMANFYYAAQGQRMNEIMKVLTIVSSIFIPLTFIAGVYGMNFKYMPELGYKNGYYTVIGVMFLLGASLFVFFVSRGWIKRRDYTKQE